MTKDKKQSWKIERCSSTQITIIIQTKKHMKCKIKQKQKQKQKHKRATH